MNNKVKKFELDSKSLKVKELLNKDFLELKIKAISTANPNRNGSHFTKESLVNAIPSFYNKPILGSFSVQQDDFRAHEGDLDYDEELDSLYYDYTDEIAETPLGLIRGSDEVKVYTDKKDGLDWIEFSCAIWVKYNYKQVKKLLKSKDGHKKISVEVEVNDSEFDDQGIEHIKDFNFSGVTILGDKYETGIADADMTILDLIDNAVFQKKQKALNFAYNDLDKTESLDFKNQDSNKKDNSPEIENEDPEENISMENSKKGGQDDPMKKNEKDFKEKDEEVKCAAEDPKKEDPKKEDEAKDEKDPEKGTKKEDESKEEDPDKKEDPEKKEDESCGKCAKCAKEEDPKEDPEEDKKEKESKDEDPEENPEDKKEDESCGKCAKCAAEDPKKEDEAKDDDKDDDDEDDEDKDDKDSKKEDESCGAKFAETVDPNTEPSDASRNVDDKSMGQIVTDATAAIQAPPVQAEVIGDGSQVSSAVGQGPNGEPANVVSENAGVEGKINPQQPDDSAKENVFSASTVELDGEQVDINTLLERYNQLNEKYAELSQNLKVREAVELAKFGADFINSDTEVEEEVRKEFVEKVNDKCEKFELNSQEEVTDFAKSLLAMYYYENMVAKRNKDVNFSVNIQETTRKELPASNAKLKDAINKLNHVQ